MRDPFSTSPPGSEKRNTHDQNPHRRRTNTARPTRAPVLPQLRPGLHRTFACVDGQRIHTTRLETSLRELTIFGVSICSAKPRANKIRSHAAGSPASACGLAGGRRLARSCGNCGTDCRSPGVGSDRDLAGYRPGGLLERPQLAYRGPAGGRRPVQSTRLPSSRELHQRMRRGRPITGHVLGMGQRPRQHRRPEKGTDLMRSIRRRLPGRRLGV